MTLNNARNWTIFWVIAALIFNLGIYQFYGVETASQFLNVYLVEKLLSFDNLFVFLLIFNHFNVPEHQRRKVLNYGLAGAVILRGLFIGAGITIVEQFSWILYILGGILIYSAWGVAFGEEDDDNIAESRIIKFAKSFSIAPIFIWIMAIELSDIAFAIDSIPASLSMSQNIFIIFTANIFAILGLRSFYFIIQSMYEIMPNLKYGIGLILAFIGVKIFLELANIYILPIYSLLAIISILLINLLTCIILKNKEIQCQVKY